MGVNAKLAQGGVAQHPLIYQPAKTVKLADGSEVPASPLFALTDGEGNVLKVTDNSDGTFSPAVVTSPAGPATSGGLSAYRNLDLGVTGQIVKNGAGQIYGYYIYNNAATVRFVKVYNKATAPTQADTPIFTWAIPANAGANRSIPAGVAFAAGISLRGTTGVADNDTGAPTANDLIVNVEYA